MAYYRQFRFLLFLNVLAFNSCIDDDFTDIDPNLVYDAEFSLPLGADTLLMEQLVQAVSLVEIPPGVDKDTVPYFLYNNVYYYSPGTLSDSITFPLILTAFENETAEITSLMFRMNMANLIPAEFLIQVYFADSNKAILGSLYEDGPFRLDPAQTDEYGNVIASWEVMINEYLSPGKFEMLTDMTNVILGSKMIIPDSSTDSVPFYPDQSLWMQAGIRVGLKMTINVY